MAPGKDLPRSHAARRPGLWLVLILLAALALRSYRLAYPVWDYHNWRQTITLMVARDFARHGFSLLHPQVAWIANRPSDPSNFSAEFSIQSVLAALLYRAFGESGALARCVVIAFSLLGIACLYHLLNRRVGTRAAAVGAFIYSILPYHIFFGRVFMPDIPAISLALAALDALDRWTSNRKPGWLIASAVLTAAAVLQKLTLIFVGLPLAYLLALGCGRDLPRKRQPYLFALIAGLPVLAWYAHSIAIARQSVFAMDRGLFGAHLGLWVERPFSLGVLRALSTEAFSPVGMALLIAGLICPAKGRTAWIFRLWLAGAALLLFLMPGVLPSNHYYLTLLLPGGAALSGMFLASLARVRGGYALVAVALAALTVSAIHSVRPFYDPDRLPFDLGRLLNGLTQPADLLVTETDWNPNVLYYTGRRGWLLQREYSMDRIAYLSQAGARYYADTFPADAARQRQFFDAMDARYQRMTTKDSPWQVYDLHAAVGPSRDLAPAQNPTSRAVNFGDRIELRGISFRPILDWPPAFEAAYSWECLRMLPLDLRVFVHITDPDGRTVYQQDHWPQSGLFPTSKWKPGDLIRERYVVTLPGSIPPGKYQVRVGWFDPASGARLPIRDPGALPGDDRAIAAEINVAPEPRYGWFGLEYNP